MLRRINQKIMLSKEGEAICPIIFAGEKIKFRYESDICSQNEYCYIMDDPQCISKFILPNEECTEKQCLCYKNQNDFGKIFVDKIFLNKSDKCYLLNDNILISSQKIIFTLEKCDYDNCLCKLSDKMEQLAPGFESENKYCLKNEHCGFDGSKLACSECIVGNLDECSNESCICADQKREVSYGIMIKGQICTFNSDYINQPIIFEKIENFEDCNHKNGCFCLDPKGSNKKPLICNFGEFCITDFRNVFCRKPEIKNKFKVEDNNGEACFFENQNKKLDYDLCYKGQTCEYSENSKRRGCKDNQEKMIM